MFDNTFGVREYADGEPFAAAGLEVTPRRVPHYDLLTFGLRVSNSSHTLAYSGDSAPSEQLVELARDVDLFLCEATLAQQEPDLRGHLTAEEAVEAFEDSGARRLVVIHRPHELPVHLPTGEVPAAPQEQRLLQRLLEPPVSLLAVPVLVSAGRVRRLRH